MGSEMVLIKQLFLISAVVFFHEVAYSIVIALQTHIFGQISKMSFLFLNIFWICDKGPGNDWILGDIAVAATGYLI